MAQEFLDLFEAGAVLERPGGAGRPHRVAGVARRQVRLLAPVLKDPVDLLRGELAVGLVGLRCGRLTRDSSNSR